MAIKSYNPTTPSRRNMSVIDNSGLSKVAPFKGLLKGKKSSGGRNNQGRITTRFRGAGNKRCYRMVDFNRNKEGIAAKVVTIEYDPNRTANIALISYADGEKAYVGYNHDAAGNTKGGGILNRKVALTVPMGIELTYKMNETLDFFVDATTNFVDSDILDCFYSGEHKDYHSTMNVGLRYKFKNTCVAKAEEEAANEAKDECCITPEELKQAIKEALEEQAAKDTVVKVKTEIIEKTYHVNHANIVFPVNKSEKLATQTNIDAVNRASNEVQSGFEVESIIVEGYASPEGGDDINNRLAEERAQAAADLIQSELHTHLDDNHVTIHSNGADWDGLVNAILGSDMDNKEEIANKIKNASNKDQTLNELMGQYPQIRELLPQLRRANVTIKTVK